MREGGNALLVLAALSKWVVAETADAADSHTQDLPSLMTMLPLWSPLTHWERISGPSYRDLWRQLPQLPGVYTQSLVIRDIKHTTHQGDCSILAGVPVNATAVVWSGIGVAFRHYYAHSNCSELVSELENRTTIVAFEPHFTGVGGPRGDGELHSTIGCPRVQKPPGGGNKYLIVPYPSQFHATSDAAIRSHIASIKSVERTHLAAYFGGAHGREVALRNQLHSACIEAGYERCAHIGFETGVEDKGCTVPRHKFGYHGHKCENGTSIAEKETGAFGRILYAYLRSEFCLMPSGDTPSRQGIMDALLVGCIPVFFATCVREVLYDEAYHPFIPRFERHRFGAGRWSVLLNSTRILTDPGQLIAGLEAIGPNSRRAMRENIASFLPQLQYSAPGVRLRDFEDAQQVYERIMPQLPSDGTSRAMSLDAEQANMLVAKGALDAARSRFGNATVDTIQRQQRQEWRAQHNRTNRPTNRTSGSATESQIKQMEQ